MSTFAADSFDEIRAARDKIRAEAVPQCPVNAGMTLFNCLRSSTKCGEKCPLKEEWIGPDPAAGAYC